MWKSNSRWPTEDLIWKSDILSEENLKFLTTSFDTSTWKSTASNVMVCLKRVLKATLEMGIFYLSLNNLKFLATSFQHQVREAVKNVLADFAC